MLRILMWSATSFRLVFTEVGKNLGLSTAKPNSKPRLQSGLKPMDLSLHGLKP